MDTAWFARVAVTAAAAVPWSNRRRSIVFMMVAFRVGTARDGVGESARLGPEGPLVPSGGPSELLGRPYRSTHTTATHRDDDVFETYHPPAREPRQLAVA
jgi:hypothetical protein